MLNRISILTLIVLGIAALAMPSAARAQTTWYVDDDAPNDPGPGDPTVSDPLEDGSAEHPFDAIQEGIDAGSDGDTVLVADGTYTGAGNKNLDFDGRAITVRSLSGAESCVIDCEGDGRGFRFHSNEGPTSVIRGFTITRGAINGNGAGIYCLFSSPTVLDCKFVGNTVGGWFESGAGGGMYNAASSPTVINCTFIGNSGPNLFGESYGGAIYNWLICHLTVINCTFNGNTAGVGGGICNVGSNATVVNCTFTGNTATATNFGGGGGIFNNGPTPSSVLTVINCTFSGNSAIVEGGGMLNVYFCTSNMANCVFWDNTPNAIYSEQTTHTTVSYSDVEGGWPGEGNIDADPLFVDPDGPDDDPNTWEDNDYRLSPGSPCIDAADNTAVPLDSLDLDGDGDFDERIPLDLDGKPRFVQDPFTPDTGVPDPPRYRFIVDMGAYEYQFCFGDLDDDDDVDIGDLAQLLGSYGETSEMTYYDGDLDGDGDVDLADLAELLGLYGTVCE